MLLSSKLKKNVVYAKTKGDTYVKTSTKYGCKVGKIFHCYCIQNSIYCQEGNRCMEYEQGPDDESDYFKLKYVMAHNF